MHIEHGTGTLVRETNGSGLQKRNSAATTTFLKLLSLATLIIACLIALIYSSQLPLELYSFRQTQTALTSFWFVKEGFQLAYQTPVAGAPWSIPFEFPFYQYLVAIISQVLDVNLIAAGRVLSFTFLLLCLPPTAAVCKKLDLPKNTIYIFTPLLLSCPLYLFWSRTFMIETAAIFLAVAAINYYVDYIQKRTLKSVLLFALFISASALQKTTTALPILAVLGVVLLAYEISQSGIRGTFTAKNIFHALLLFVVPLAICVLWTAYTDAVKSQNAFGNSLTSSALSVWNWGRLGQRFSGNLYVTVIWERIIRDNLAGMLGVAMILLGLELSSLRPKIIIAVAAVLGLLPLFIFSNLHIVHTYYQTANVIFLIFALSVAFAEAFTQLRKTAAISAVFIAVILVNYFNFYNTYYKYLTQNFYLDNREIFVSAITKNNTQADDSTLIFGNDWSSTLAFLSERKSFTVPQRFKDYSSILDNPERYMGSSRLGAVILCQSVQHPTTTELLNWAAQRDWKLTQADSCYIALRKNGPEPAALAPVQPKCEGSLDQARWSDNGLGELFISGWLNTHSGAHQIVYVTLTGADGKTVFHEATPIPRRDLGAAYVENKQGPKEFSVLIKPAANASSYQLGVAVKVDERLETCNVSKQVDAPASH